MTHLCRGCEPEDSRPRGRPGVAIYLPAARVTPAAGTLRTGYRGRCRKASRRTVRNILPSNQAYSRIERRGRSPVPVDPGRNENDGSDRREAETGLGLPDAMKGLSPRLTGGFIGRRVRSWLRMNAGGAPNTCKSNGTRPRAEASGERLSNTWRTRPPPGDSLRKRRVTPDDPDAGHPASGKTPVEGGWLRGPSGRRRG